MVHCNIPTCRLSVIRLLSFYGFLSPLTDGLPPRPGFGAHGLHFNWLSIDLRILSISATYLYNAKFQLYQNCTVAIFSSPIYNAKSGGKVVHFVPTEESEHKQFLFLQGISTVTSL